jgi:serine/threonine protein kinase
MEYDRLIQNFPNLPRAGNSVSANARRNSARTVVIKKYKSTSDAEKEFKIHSHVYSLPGASRYIVKPLYQRNSFFIQVYQPNMLGTLDTFITKMKFTKSMGYEKSVTIFDNILKQIKAIVKFLNRNGIDHNDLHLGNFVVYKQDRKLLVKVIDFGKSTFTTNRSRLSQMNVEGLARFGQYVNDGWLVNNKPLTNALVPRYQFNAMVKNALSVKPRSVLPLHETIYKKMIRK